MKIVIIEDELKTARFLGRGLTEAGCVIDVAGDGLQGLHRRAVLLADGIHRAIRG
jgi:two-component system copper resistance phosphate regulon response regulator CusR